jgi:hypothetical protein
MWTPENVIHLSWPSTEIHWALLGKCIWLLGLLVGWVHMDIFRLVHAKCKMDGVQSKICYCMSLISAAFLESQGIEKMHVVCAMK